MSPHASRRRRLALLLALLVCIVTLGAPLPALAAEPDEPVASLAPVGEARAQGEAAEAPDDGGAPDARDAAAAQAPSAQAPDVAGDEGTTAADESAPAVPHDAGAAVDASPAAVADGPTDAGGDVAGPLGDEPAPLDEAGGRPAAGEPSPTDSAAAAAGDVLPPASDGPEEGAHRGPVKPQLVTDGRYLVRTGMGSALVLDTAGSANAKGANVVQARYSGGSTQLWNIAFDAVRGFYQVFRNATDGTVLVLDVSGGAVANRTNVRLWTSNNSDAQWWDIERSGSGWRLVSALGPSYVLDIANGSAKDGANVQMYTSNGSQAQRFSLHSVTPQVAPGARVVADGPYHLVSTIAGASDNVADIAGGSLANGGNAQSYARNGSIAQRFYLSYHSGGYYTVSAIGSGRVLDASLAGLLPGTNVQQYASNGTAAQRWVIRGNANGSYTLINMANGLALDVAGGSGRSGANLQLYTPNASPAQQFELRGVQMLPTGIFTIAALSNGGRVADIKDGSASSGAVAQLYASNGSLAQKFELVSSGTGANEYRIRTAASGGWLTATKNGAQLTQQGDHATAASVGNIWVAAWKNGHFVLVSKATGTALTMEGGSTASGTRLTTATTTGGASQQFALKATQLLGEGCYFLASLKGPRLAVAGGSTRVGANVVVDASANVPGQYFMLERSGSAWRIKSASSGAYVTAAGTTGSSNVSQQGSGSSDRQRWKLRIADGGGVIFESVAAPGLVLDVAGGKTASGTNVQLYANNNSAAQAWRPAKTTYTPYSGYVLRAVRRANGSRSATGYLLVVDKSQHKVLVMTGGNGAWRPYKTFSCSVGAYGTPTVEGSFTVGSRGYSFGDGYTCYYWTQFYHDYLFHSVKYYQGTRTVMDGRLGMHISHGCVRMPIDNARWIYNTIPTGTRVLVYS